MIAAVFGQCSTDVAIEVIDDVFALMSWQREVLDHLLVTVGWGLIKNRHTLEALAVNLRRG